MTRRIATTALTTAALLATAAVAAPPAQAAPASLRVVVDGLLNPRNVSIGANGDVYVAESGRGGATLVTTQVEGQQAPACIGHTGGVTRVDKRGKVTRFGGFPSVAGAVSTPAGPSCEGGGFAATGPASAAGDGRGTVAVTIGLGGSTTTRAAIGVAGAGRLGTLESLLPNGRTRTLADIAAHENSDPDGAGVDSNAYGTAFLPDGGRLVADAGGNTLVRVAPDGSTSTVAVFGVDGGTRVPALACTPPPGFPPPGVPIPAQAVPTGVAYHDGAAYVGFLGGFPFTPGHASVKRVDLASGAVTTVASGLTAVVGVDVAPDGTVYAVEMARDGLLNGEICGQWVGRLVRASGGVVTEVPTAQPLIAPGGVAVADDGTVYVSTGSILPGGGALVALG